MQCNVFRRVCRTPAPAPVTALGLVFLCRIRVRQSQIMFGNLMPLFEQLKTFHFHFIKQLDSSLSQPAPHRLGI